MQRTERSSQESLPLEAQDTVLLDGDSGDDSDASSAGGLMPGARGLATTGGGREAERSAGHARDANNPSFDLNSGRRPPGQDGAEQARELALAQHAAEQQGISELNRQDSNRKHRSTRELLGQTESVGEGGLAREATEQDPTPRSQEPDTQTGVAPWHEPSQGAGESRNLISSEGRGEVQGQDAADGGEEAPSPGVREASQKSTGDLDFGDVGGDGGDAGVGGSAGASTTLGGAGTPLRVTEAVLGAALQSGVTQVEQSTTERTRRKEQQVQDAGQEEGSDQLTARQKGRTHRSEGSERSLGGEAGLGGGDRDDSQFRQPSQERGSRDQERQESGSGNAALTDAWSGSATGNRGVVVPGAQQAPSVPFAGAFLQTNRAATPATQAETLAAHVPPPLEQPASLPPASSAVPGPGTSLPPASSGMAAGMPSGAAQEGEAGEGPARPALQRAAGLGHPPVATAFQGNAALPGLPRGLPASGSLLSPFEGDEYFFFDDARPEVEAPRSGSQKKPS